MRCVPFAQRMYVNHHFGKVGWAKHFRFRNTKKAICPFLPIEFNPDKKKPFSETCFDSHFLLKNPSKLVNVRDAQFKTAFRRQ